MTTASTSMATGTTTRRIVSAVEVRGGAMTTAASVPSSPLASLVSDTAASQMNGFLQCPRNTICSDAVFLGCAVVGVALGRGRQWNVAIDLARPGFHHHDAVGEV